MAEEAKDMKKKEVTTLQALGIIAATIAAPAIIYIELLLICAALG